MIKSRIDYGWVVLYCTDTMSRDEPFSGKFIIGVIIDTRLLLSLAVNSNHSCRAGEPEPGGFSSLEPEPEPLGKSQEPEPETLKN